MTSAGGPPAERAPAARAAEVWKVYGSGDAEVIALRNVELAIAAGAFTAIMGPSGSGKSTLMHCLAGLDTTTRGTVHIGDTQVTGLSDAGLTKLRRDKVGFIFQQFNLLPTLTAAENIQLPLSIAGRKPDQAWYDTVIDTVNLRDRLGHKPTQLSGGQQQRVACARALVSRPEVIFADEPTGNLDSRSSAEVLEFLRRSVDEFGQTIVMVTHDPGAASYADRVIFLADGAIVDELTNPTADEVLDELKKLDAVTAGRQDGNGDTAGRQDGNEAGGRMATAESRAAADNRADGATPSRGTPPRPAGAKDA